MEITELSCEDDRRDTDRDNNLGEDRSMACLISRTMWMGKRWGKGGGEIKSSNDRQRKTRKKYFDW